MGLGAWAAVPTARLACRCRARGLGTWRSPLSRFLPARLPAAPPRRAGSGLGRLRRPGVPSRPAQGPRPLSPRLGGLLLRPARLPRFRRHRTSAEPLAGPRAVFWPWVGEGEAEKERERAGEGGAGRGAAAFA